MPSTPEKIEVLAKALAEVHSHSFVPFYAADSAPMFWEKLPEKAATTSDVDKQFFRAIARQIDKFL